MFNPFSLIEQITAVALVVQSIELLQIRHTLTDDDSWSWKIIRDDFQSLPAAMRWMLDRTLAFPNIVGLISLQLLCAIALIATSHLLLNCLLLLTSILLSLRWRGTFNGGSDYMTALLLCALVVARLTPHQPQIQLGCLWYIALQVCASYLVAGVVKLRRKRWRDGTALPAILALPQYSAPALSQLLTRNPHVSFALSWSTMLFECAFPLALFNQTACLVLMGIAFVFHLTNAALLGLNRFLLIWPAAYPALYFCSTL